MFKATARDPVWNSRLIQVLFRTPATAGLPERVAAIVRKKDRESEQLLCLVQFLLAATIGALYVIAPRPADVGMSLLQPVPVALAAYTLLNIVRSWYVRKAPLPRWAVVLSITADTGLLFGLIWSFHSTYGQPPAFSLKAPTFVYIFVFTSIRALRFDFRYVLLSGLVGAAGWLFVTLAALALSPDGTVTRNFTEYMLSNRILLGAEFDKIFALLAVTLVLSLAAWRAERTLIAAVREEIANREIGRFLSRGVAEQIAQAETLVSAGHVVEREAAIMFLDIRGFTRLSMLVPPSEVVQLLTGFHARIVPIVRAHNGVIDKFLGDGVMITFGAVAVSNRAAADALRALEALLAETARWQSSVRESGNAGILNVNASVAAGRVVFAAVGDENRLEYTVIGEAVNLAAKLEKHNKIEQSLAVAPLETLRLAEEQGFVPVSTPLVRPMSGVAGVSGTIDLAVWNSAAKPKPTHRAVHGL